MSKLQPVRGTHDILPEEFEKFHAVVTRARELAALYGFREMATPIFEATEVFSRSMGETSDVVAKEMFTFETRGGESVTLRPEFTAGIVRAFLSNGMQQHLPLKLFSTGPLFRYERPQKGRQRQFHQVNFEWLGDGSPEADVEMICLASQLLYCLSGRDGCTLHINSLGDQESRAKYRDVLVAYLTLRTDELSEDSRRRLAVNPLRILDSKDARDKEILRDAPLLTQHLNDASKRRFDAVLKLLAQKDMPVSQAMRVYPSPTLVRGLDYYTDVVFEFVAEAGDLGAQNTVLAGGRYDGLVEQMGGKPTPAIGFAAGIERLLLLAQPDAFKASRRISIVLLPLEEVAEGQVLRTAAVLRDRLYAWASAASEKITPSVEILWRGNLGKRLSKAVEQGATHAVIMGKEEAEREACKVKDLTAKTEKEVPFSHFTQDEQFTEIFNIAKLDSRLRGNEK